MSKGQTPSIKKYGGDQGINPNKLKIVVGSGADKSCIHPKKGAWRISIVTNSTLYNAKKTGICTKIGRQPEAGLAFSRL